MYKGIVIYNKSDYNINSWFANELISKFNEFDISLKLLFEDEISKDLISNLKDIDLVIYRGRNFKLIENIEKHNVLVINNSLTNKIANNKYLTNEFCKENDIEVMETSLSCNDLNLPFIMKSVDGHGGKEVFLINDINEVKNILSKYKNKQFVYQKVASNTGKDLRVYMLDNKILVSILRESINGDFRSNYSLNQNAKVVNLDKKTTEIAINLSKLLKSDFIGIDFILNEDKWILNEIEDPVGSRMIYNLTNIDLCFELAKTCYNLLKEK